MRKHQFAHHWAACLLLAATVAGCSSESQSPASVEMETVKTPKQVEGDANSTPPAKVSESSVAPSDLPKGPQAGDPLYPGESKEGLAWLQRNQFPTSEDWRSTDGRQAQLVEIDLNDGISALELIQLEQLAIADKDGTNEATELLNQAVSMGSMYALEVLGRVYEAQGNRVWSRAYYQAAQIRGNWAVALRPKPPASDVEIMISEVMAQQIIDKANSARARNGLPPLTYEPRPGAEVMLMAISEQVLIDQAKTSQGEGR